MKRFALIALVALSGCGSIPPEFDRPFNGSMFDIYEPASKVAADCFGSWDLQSGQYAGACSRHFSANGSSVCLRILPDNQSPFFLAETKRIEQANCNGWAEQKWKDRQ